MHFSIRYLTEYRYESPVTDNLNALRVRPATTSSQRCDEFHTRIDPEARVSRHLDYFGTEVLEFGIPASHERLDGGQRRVAAREQDELLERLDVARRLLLGEQELAAGLAVGGRGHLVPAGVGRGRGLARHDARADVDAQVVVRLGDAELEDLGAEVVGVAADPRLGV